jgi:hypothetical protein
MRKNTWEEPDSARQGKWKNSKNKNPEMEMNMVCLGVKKSMWLELRDESVEQSE